MCACKNLGYPEWIFFQFNTEAFYNNCEVIYILCDKNFKNHFTLTTYAGARISHITC